MQPDQYRVYVYFKCRNWKPKIRCRRLKKANLKLRKKLEVSIANGGRNENTDIQEKAENCTANEEDVAKLIQ